MRSLSSGRGRGIGRRGLGVAGLFRVAVLLGEVLDRGHDELAEQDDQRRRQGDRDQEAEQAQGRAPDEDGQEDHDRVQPERVAEDVGDRLQARLGAPVWIRPAIAGAILGGIAVWFPHIIGVGYETTTLALTGALPLWLAIGFAAIKGVAVAVTYAGRMGGGVFSPALMMGALTGLAFGQVATAVFPDMSGASGLYALAGMGAVAAAVLGAPISTTLIVFELTGDYQTAIAVMVSVSLASVTAHRFVWKSFFLSQLMRRGVKLAEGQDVYLPASISVRGAMRLRGAEDCASDGDCAALIAKGVTLTMDRSLADALPMFDAAKVAFIPVVAGVGGGDGGGDGGGEGGGDGREAGALIGAIHHIDALKVLNRALIEADRERGA